MLNNARAAVATLQSAMSLCGLLSIPASNARGCGVHDAMLTIASTARSLTRPTKANENARTTLSCAFTTALTAMRGLGHAC